MGLKDLSSGTQYKDWRGRQAGMCKKESEGESVVFMSYLEFLSKIAYPYQSLKEHRGNPNSASFYITEMGTLLITVAYPRFILMTSKVPLWTQRQSKLFGS